MTAQLQWYNEEHRHSGISYVTPSQRHQGLDVAILQTRREVYETARIRNPRRWSKSIRSWERPDEVHLTPPIAL